MMELSTCQSNKVGGTPLSGRGSMQSSARPRHTGGTQNIRLPGQIALKQYGRATPPSWHSSGYLVQIGQFLYIGDTTEAPNGSNRAAVSSGSLWPLSVSGLEGSGPVVVDALGDTGRLCAVDQMHRQQNDSR